MSENTWEIMKGMELGDVELQMALQCAPVITGSQGVKSAEHKAQWVSSDGGDTEGQ